jgi:DNA-binding beta-propeller fold protein YncE
MPSTAKGWVRHAATLALCLAVFAPASAAYTNFEVSHVHPIALTPGGARLLVVNTPDARLEVFTVLAGGSLAPEASIPVGMEPVTVTARTASEAWVVNNLSDTVSIVNLDQRRVTKTLVVGDEPLDVVFAQGKAFVAVSQEDAVKVWNLADLNAAPTVVPVFSRLVRALAVSKDGLKVYAVTQRSGNQTTVVNANIAFGNNANLNTNRLSSLGLNNMTCASPPPPYPPLPAGIVRNPALTDPPDGIPHVGLIVKFNNAASQWQDETGQSWNDCLPYRLPDHDLFVIDAVAPTAPQQFADHLGTTLFEVSVNPVSGKIYVPGTEARNQVRFEHQLGVQGHVVDNRLAVVDPASLGAPLLVDLNAHVDYGSNPATNLAERQASISQPGMMAWKADGTAAYLTAIGSRKLFKMDGACTAGSCIFGASRAAPSAVVVGEGPTGVALHEGVNRAYVLNRFSNSVAIVDAAALVKLSEIPLHDPSSSFVKSSRRLLYDGIDTSGHGDSACSSCHISGDLDGLAWDLGAPQGSFVPYSSTLDNVRFVQADCLGGAPCPPPVECEPGSTLCAAHDGFDPQKGPMATQTLRAMLEPLHWRGDRATFNDFNPAFVGLLGRADLGPINGKPAGLTAEQMEDLRQFVLGFAMPPNPFRNVDNTIPNSQIQPFGSPFVGNPVLGQSNFHQLLADALQPCDSCHHSVFGTAGGQLGGVTPSEPASSTTTALFHGDADQSPHSDLEIPHLRNLYTKFGPTFGTVAAPLDAKTGFGFTHDGAMPDLGTFLSINVFTLTPRQARDIATWLFTFETGTLPAVGRNVTLPPGSPPTGTTAEEALFATLVAFGNLTNAARHCELTASIVTGETPPVLRTWYLNGTSGLQGLWTPDITGQPQVTTTVLRATAAGPLQFLCVPIGEGVRLGSDLDSDLHPNGSDCNPGDDGAWAAPVEISGFTTDGRSPTHLAWSEQATATGPGIVYDAVSGALSTLRASGLAAATSCLASGLTVPSYDDVRPNPPVGDGWFYLARARNSCASGTFGPGREVIDTLVCP